MGENPGDSRDEQLSRALDRGLDRLPPNEPRGILGETNPDVRKEEDYTPDLNAGISQENDMPVVWMAIVLGYLLFFVPGFVILWLSRSVPVRTKWIATAVGLIGVAGFVTLAVRR